MAYVITEPCIGVKDASCLDVCPVDCIYTTDADNMYFIHPDECIDCGACESVCPVSAIFPEDAVPDKWNARIRPFKGRGRNEEDPLNHLRQCLACVREDAQARRNRKRQL